MSNTQIKTSGIVGLIVMAVGILGLIYVKGCVAKRTAQRAQWNDCLKTYFGGKHALQRMPVPYRGQERSPYLIMENGRATFSFEIDGNYFVQSLPSSKIKMAMDMKTRKPWIEFQYNDYMRLAVGCRDIDKVFLYNVDYATVHLAAQDFQYTPRSQP